MCGIAGIVGGAADADLARADLTRALESIAHRGPDSSGTWSADGVRVGAVRLAVLDVTAAGSQPAVSRDGRWVLVYNGEVYNHLEIARSLGLVARSRCDTEVVVEAIAALGPVGAVHRFIGMFAFAAWDRVERELWLARDRFGVKPLHWRATSDAVWFASEAKALAAMRLDLEPHEGSWADYLVHGLSDADERSFFEGVHTVPAGSIVRWQDGYVSQHRWYDLQTATDALGPDDRPDDVVQEECLELLRDATRLRFRSDVPVGVCLSGGVDSSLLVSLLVDLFGEDADVAAHHFITGDDRYDETPWVRRLLEQTACHLHVTSLSPAEVPALAERSIWHQEGPFGGVPTLAMTKLFADARSLGTIVLLDGQGLDEQWAGYDHYREPPRAGPVVQGSTGVATRTSCLSPGLRERATHLEKQDAGDLRSRRIRDISTTKLPRALRFGDRASSQASCELREPFLDHRLAELALRQPASRLIDATVGKVLLRRIASSLLPKPLALAPKRAVQTPQREWLAGPLVPWVDELLEEPLVRSSGWFDRDELDREWSMYRADRPDSSFHVWQWISVGLSSRLYDRLRATTRAARGD